MSRLQSMVSEIPGLRRVENFPKEEMQNLAMELTHSVYTHEEVYGGSCTLIEAIDCPPEEVLRYLADSRNLAEWTYSLRDFEPASSDGLMVSYDRIGGSTRIFTRTEVNLAAGTVDYHCAWDQGDHLWMIYLMRVVPAKVVLNRPGSVVTWTNLKHPFYEVNPYPDRVPESRKVWVGDLWPFFYAGHYVEMQNLKRILEHRFREVSVVSREEASA